MSHCPCKPWYCTWAELKPYRFYKQLARIVHWRAACTVFAFSDAEHSVANLAGNLCAVEAGHAYAVEILQQLAEALGLTAFAMPSEYKACYHAALSAASNFSVTLAEFAQNLLKPLALPETLSRLWSAV
ncbi:DUF2520 domain-containing protein [Neisseria iguanae]|uniref:DUF2520 domain-containing protein n=1 Tax=Neisseria iguanae TaxID=90242 RepID=UPI001FE9E6E7|nr:DUF2520 domain-containing protein [Neisseria iguanae]